MLSLKKFWVKVREFLKKCRTNAHKEQWLWQTVTVPSSCFGR